MSTGIIDFDKIKLHGGSITNAFETLAVQVFTAENSNPSINRTVTVINGSGGDGGAEAFYKDRDENYHCVQAKHFGKLTSSEWGKIKSSLKAARKNFSPLKSYTVVVNHDRTRGITNKKTTSKKRRKGQLEAWEEIVKDNLDVKLIWWGKHELTGLLNKKENEGTRIYFTDTPGIDPDSFKTISNASIKSLKCRYTPKRDIHLEINRQLEAITLPKSFVHDFDNVIDVYSEQFYKLREDLKYNSPAPLKRVLALAVSAINSITEDYWGNNKKPTLRNIFEFQGKILEELSKLESSIRSIDLPPLQDGQVDQSKNAIFSNISRFTDKAWKLRAFCKKYECIDSQNILITGQAGTGKSHLMASLVQYLQEQNSTVLLLTGEHFSNSDPVFNQILKRADLNISFKDFLSCLNTIGKINHKPSFICIDAINETPDRKIWKTGLLELEEQLKPYTSIKLLVTCRSDFKESTLPNDLRNASNTSWSYLSHNGYDARAMQDAIANYFKEYKVKTDQIHNFLPEFQNPLFLKTFCEAFEDGSIPQGAMGIKTIIEKRLDRLCDKIAETKDYKWTAIKKMLMEIADKVSQSQTGLISEDVAREILGCPLKNGNESNSLYKQIVSDEILSEVYRGDNLHVKFSYERFSDYFRADYLLKEINTKDELIKKWTDCGLIEKYKKIDNVYWDKSLLWILSILVPEKASCELIDIIGTKENRAPLLELYIETLAWRNVNSIPTKNKKLLYECIKVMDHSNFLACLLQIAAIPNHPFNSNLIYNWIKRLTLPQRELKWGICLLEPTSVNRDYPTDALIQWGLNAPLNFVSDEQSYLAAQALALFFSVTNQDVRDKATYAVIRLLKGRVRVAIILLNALGNDIDPYIVERVFAVMAGVAMAEKDKQSLRDLASAVYKLFFANKSTLTAHLLTRDYAYTVMATASMQGCLPKGISERDYSPPYKSDFPQIITEPQASQIEEHSGWETIRRSIRPNVNGWYGDFGRYEMEAVLSNFQGKSRGKANSKDSTEFDAMKGRRYIIQRIIELGWTPELFKKYEDVLDRQQYAGRSRPKTERISKKYQWIALRELVGYLSDHHDYRPDYGDSQSLPFMGAWEIRARDFDPSIAWEENEHESFDQASPYSKISLSPIPPEMSIEDRIKWIKSKPHIDIKKILEIKSNQRLMISGYLEVKEKIKPNFDLGKNGRLREWLNIRAWIINDKSLESFLKEIQNKSFYGNGLGQPETRSGWLGEYPWANSHKDAADQCRNNLVVISKKDLKTTVCETVCDFGFEPARHGASLPSPQLFEELKLKWTGEGFTYQTSQGQFVESVRENHSNYCFVDRQLIEKSLNNSSQRIVWVFIGEKSCWNGNEHNLNMISDFSGIYFEKDGKPYGQYTNFNVKHIK